MESMMIVLCDVKELPLRERSFDVALCMEVLEHLERRFREGLIQSMKKTTRRPVIRTTPVGEFKQLAYDENPYQEHKWIWSPIELKRFEYKVRWFGIRDMGGEVLVSRLPRILRPFCHVAWVLTGLLIYFYLTLAGHMVCVKSFIGPVLI